MEMVTELRHIKWSREMQIFEGNEIGSCTESRKNPCPYRTRGNPKETTNVTLQLKASNNVPTDSRIRIGAVWIGRAETIFTMLAKTSMMERKTNGISKISIKHCP